MTEADLLRENAELRAGVADLTGRNARLRKTLKRIEKWTGEFPKTNHFWDEKQTDPMSYAAAFGSNGERDFMRGLAAKALRETAPASLEAIRAEVREAVVKIFEEWRGTIWKEEAIKAIRARGDGGESKDG